MFEVRKKTQGEFSKMTSLKLEHMQVSHGTGPNVRRCKRPLMNIFHLIVMEISTWKN